MLLLHVRKKNNAGNLSNQMADLIMFSVKKIFRLVTHASVNSDGVICGDNEHKKPSSQINKVKE